MTIFYVTSFCNFPHNAKTGRPMAHECYIIPPKALAIEMNEGAEVALKSKEWTKFYQNKGPAIRGR